MFFYVVPESILGATTCVASFFDKAKASRIAAEDA